MMETFIDNRFVLHRDMIHAKQKQIDMLIAEVAEQQMKIQTLERRQAAFETYMRGVLDGRGFGGVHAGEIKGMASGMDGGRMDQPKSGDDLSQGAAETSSGDPWRFRTRTTSNEECGCGECVQKRSKIGTGGTNRI